MNSISPEQIRIVKKTWRKLMGIDQAILGDLFYSRLFMDYPELRRLFPKDMSSQYIKLTDMLTSIITQLDHPENFTSDLISMGMRHTQYGVKPHHYAMVGNALMWTLEKALEPGWDQATQNAWTHCYQNLEKIMLSNA